MDDKLLIGPCAHYINLAIIKKEQLSQEEADEFTRATLHGRVDQILCQKEPVHLEGIILSLTVNHPSNAYSWKVHQALARVHLHGNYAINGMS